MEKKRKIKSWCGQVIRDHTVKKMFRMTKLVLLFMLIGVGQILALDSYSQTKKLTLNFKAERLENVLQEIESKSDFYFLYNKDLINVDQVVKLQSNNQEITKVLDQLFKGSDIRYMVMDKQIVLSNVNNTERTVKQVSKVSGMVTDESGEAIPGVSVVVKGTTVGIITDLDGKYELDLPEGSSVIVFSFVGMHPQEIVVGEQSTINVVMVEDTKDLEEVVIIGYGVQKKSNLTAAVDVVDTKALENRPIANVSEMLQGVSPNLNVTTTTSAPGKSSSLNIRGFTGLNSLGSPLVIVDGVPQSIDEVNPNDIESMSVLKDAAASAIYGSRAPNGVIIIKTKSGKKNQDMKVTYSGTFRYSSPINMPHNLNSYDFALLNNNSCYNSQGAPEYGDEVIKRIQQYINGEIDYTNIITDQGYWGGPFDANGNIDYIDEAYRDHVTNHSHNFSVQGGGKKTSYYASAGYVKQQGVYESPIDESNKKNLSLRVTTDVNEYLTVGITSKFSRRESVRPNVRGSSDDDRQFLDAMIFRPNIPSENINGEYRGYNEFSIKPSLNGDGGRVDRINDEFRTTFHGELKPIKGLNIRSSYTYAKRSNQGTITILKYAALQPNGTYTNSRRSVGTEGLKKWRGNNEYENFDITATYMKSFGKHNTTTMVGYQQELNKFDEVYTYNSDFYTSSVPSYSTMYGTSHVIDDTIYDWANQGYFGRLSYNYDGKYLLDVNVRYDASSRFSEDERWAWFPSVSMGYNLSKENFFPFKEQIQKFKLKGSWGQLGNVGTGRPQYIAPLGTNPKTPILLDGTKQPYVTQPGLISSELTWSKPETLGIGIEVATLNNRLTFEYDWYQKTIRDQLGPAEQLPEVLGANPPQRNTAITETRGWELSIGWKDSAFEIGGEAIKYGVKAMVSDYIGYVVEHTDNLTGSRSGTWTPGEEFGTLYGYESAGIQKTTDDLVNHVAPNTGIYYTGDLFYVDQNGDGVINSGQGGYWYSMGDLKKLGYTYPRYKYSILLNASWKNWSVNVLLDGVGKEERYINSKLTTAGVSIGGRGYLDFQGYLGYWSENNTEAFFPRLYRNSKNFSAVNDQYLLDLAHLRIKNINVNYVVPLKSNLIDNLSLSMSVENVGMIYYNSWNKLDPQLLKYGNYPPSRTFSFGVKCTF